MRGARANPLPDYLRSAITTGFPLVVVRFQILLETTGLAVDAGVAIDGGSHQSDGSF